MYLQNYFYTGLDDLFYTLIRPGGTANIGCWKLEVHHSENAIDDICVQLALKHQLYLEQNLGWGNIVVDIIGGSRNKDITMGELQTLLEHITQLSETKNVTRFVRTRVYDEEDAGCTMDAPIVISLLFEKTIKDAQEICSYSDIHAQQPNGKMIIEWLTDHNERVNYKEIILGETFTLDGKDILPFTSDTDIFSIYVPRHPFTFKLLDRTVEWSADPYDGCAVVRENGKVTSFEKSPVMGLGKGTYKYEQDCLTQIR